MPRDAFVAAQSVPIDPLFFPNAAPLPSLAEVEAWSSVVLKGQPVCALNALPSLTMSELEKERASLPWL